MDRRCASCTRVRRRLGRRFVRCGWRARRWRRDVVGFIPGDDTQPTIEGIVGKDLAVQQLQPPCIVRIYDVPTDGRVAFGGVFVSALGPSH